MPDIVTGKVFVDGEKGITATKLNQIQSLAVIQPSFYSGKASTSSLDPTDTLLDLKSSGSYAQISGSQLINSIASQVNVTPQIYSVRLRSFNACGNSTMEVDQRNCGASVGTANGMIIDRWGVYTSGTMVVSAQRQAAGFGSSIVVPGTNFAITNNFLRVTVTTAETTLGVSDYLTIAQQVEGPMFRELSLDVHSISLLVRTSLSSLSFGLSLRDAAATPTRSLTHLCTITSPNTWQLITIPNLPVWPTAGTFGITPGVQGYNLALTLSAGTSMTNSSNDVWNNSNTVGAVGQANFAANANATFDVAFVQHEPGANSTTLIDKPFAQNLWECKRYYQKSCLYGNKFPTNLDYYMLGHFDAGTIINSSVIFPEELAKAPSVTPTVLLADQAGNTGNVTVESVQCAVASVGATAKVIQKITLSTALGSGYNQTYCGGQWQADTGW